MSYISWGQLTQGDIIITHSGFQPGVYNSNCVTTLTNQTASEVSILHAQNTAHIPIDPNNVRYTWTQYTPTINPKPLWVNQSTWDEQHIGRIFGLTIEDANTFYVSNTSIRYGEGSSINHDAIWQLNPSTSTVVQAYAFPNPQDPTRGIGNIKYFTNGADKYMLATWWEDGSINLLWKNASGVWTNIQSFIPKFGATKSKPYNVPYGIAIRKIGSINKVYYGRLNLNSNVSSEVWTVDLIIGTPNTASFANESFAISAPLKPLTNYWSNVCNSIMSIPIADISISSDNNKILLGQQALCCTSQMIAHNSNISEFTLNPIPSQVSTNISSGNPSWGSSYSKVDGTNSVGGVSYWNNILFDSAKTKCDTTILYTTDAIYINNNTYCPVNNTELASGNFSTYTTNPMPYVYGFQAVPSRNNFTTIQDCFDKSLKVDADDNFTNFDKFNLGDIEAFNTPLNCTTLPCSCGQFDSLVLNNTTYTTAWPNLSFGQGLASGTLVTYYHCNRTTDQGCAVSYNWQVTSNGSYVGPPVTSTTNSFNLNLLNGLPCGTYSITITPTCGTLTCPPKSILVKFDCPPPVCPCAGTVTINQSAVTVVPQNNVSNINPVSTATTSFTLTSTVPVTEVRMVIDEFRLTTSTGNDNCMLCKNKPQTWANINSATLSGVATQTVSNASSLEKDIRELVFNNGAGTFFNLNGNTLNLNLGIPGVTGLNCCTLKAEVCVKFIIRDVNCCEREVLKCFTFNLQ